MKRFRLVDNLMGWLVFAVAAWTYCSTIEPTASFWDCPEFITTGYKLEVGHPPGAPFFMLTANLFSQLVSDPAQVAKMVNIMSALFSALCILFLYWTISHLVRRLICKTPAGTTLPAEMTTSQLITTQASALVGSLAYCWSDTFWFSAVEGEVYAYSSLFTALVVWLMLKWEDHADEPHSDRWLILIAYMTGLSIGVHLLNLLCLPALVLIYYYRKFPGANLKGSLLALLVSCVLVVVVLYGIVPGIVKVGGWFELLFVNQLGFGFNTGLIIYLIVLVGVVLWAIWESTVCRSLVRGNVAYLLSVALLGIPFYGHGTSSLVIGVVVLALLAVALWWDNLVSARFKNTSLLCMLLIMIGYSSYAVIVIRSTANTPMDQNSPEDIFTLGQYLGREQYGQRPLFYGPVYNSPVAYDENGSPKSKQGAAVYQRKEKASADEKDQYEIVRYDQEYEYQVNMLFPRMYSNNDRHAAAYESLLGGIEGRDAVVTDYDGSKATIRVPTFFENLKFFFSYQINYMYMRYFMWNFAGRQNDLQGNGELEHGNWITGFDWFDNWRLGDQSLLPDELKENKGHNVFYCLPLILGLIGLFWQSLKKGQKGIRQFWVVFFLFFMTGLAIVIYLNQTPMQPRERDYAYAGSFYAFAIWCGMGVAAIIEMLTERLKRQHLAIAAIVGVACLFVPVQMASQTWDDHDRSGRYTCRDFGQNYLMSLQENGNPIIFTNGDNDTFPLWYNQDVENFRTDARVCNLSYLQTDWYIDQMCRPAYDSPKLPISWNRLQYCAGTNEYVIIDPSIKQLIQQWYKEDPETARATLGDNPFELSNVLRDWVRGEVSPEKREVMKVLSGSRGDTHVIPTDTLYLTIDKEAVRKSGMLMAADSIPDRMAISLQGKNALYKGDLMMLEIIAQCNWTRPIYVAMTVGEDNYMNLGDNFVQEGLVNRITPFTTNKGLTKNFDTEKTYDILMNKFKFGGLEKPGIYLDETVMRMCYTHRRIFVQLASHLIAEGKDDKAAKVLAHLDKHIPDYNVPISYMSGSFDEARAYAAIGQKKKAMDLYNRLWIKSEQYLKWYCSLDGMRFLSSQRECMINIYVLQQTLLDTDTLDKKWSESHTPRFNSLVRFYQDKGGKLSSTNEEEEYYDEEVEE